MMPRRREPSSASAPLPQLLAAPQGGHLDAPLEYSLHVRQYGNALQAAHLAVVALPGSIARRSVEDVAHISLQLIGLDSTTSDASPTGGGTRPYCYYTPRSCSPGGSPRGALPPPPPPPLAGAAPALPQLAPGSAEVRLEPSGGAGAAQGPDAEPCSPQFAAQDWARAGTADPDAWGSSLRGRLSADGAAARFDVFAGQPPSWSPQQLQDHFQSRLRSPTRRQLLQVYRGLQPQQGATAPVFSDLQGILADVSACDVPSPSPAVRDWGGGGGGGGPRLARAEARYRAPSASEGQVQYGNLPGGDGVEDGGRHSSGGAVTAGAASSGGRGRIARGEAGSPGLLRRLMRAFTRTTRKGPGRVSCDGRGAGTAASDIGNGRSPRGSGGGSGGGGAEVLRSSCPGGPEWRHHARHWRTWVGAEGISRGGDGYGDDNGAWDGSSDEADRALQLLQLQRRDSRIVHRARLGLGERPRSGVMPKPRSAGAPLPPPSSSVSSPSLTPRSPPASPSTPVSMTVPPSTTTTTTTTTTITTSSRFLAASSAWGGSPALPKQHPTAATTACATWGYPDTPIRQPGLHAPFKAATSRDLSEVGRDKAAKVRISSIAHLRAKLASVRRSPSGDPEVEPPRPPSPSALARLPSLPLALGQLSEQACSLSEPVAVLATTRTVKRLAIHATTGSGGNAGGTSAGFF